MSTPSSYFTRYEITCERLQRLTSGAVMESIAALQHLISLLESGRDLDGVEWPQLLESARQLRLVLVPVANPDGRPAFPRMIP